LLLAAQKVVKDYDGNLPSDPKDLEKNIPGVGPYTAGAVSSIVYGRSVPLVCHPIATSGLLPSG
jgi:A/G-specific adenine glycosylase